MSLIFRYLGILLLTLSLGCAEKQVISEHSKDNLSNRRAPANNHLGADTPDISENVNTQKVEHDNFYAFNDYNEKVNYYSPPKEVFLGAKQKKKTNKKSKAQKKKVKIYKKVPKKNAQATKDVKQDKVTQSVSKKETGMKETNAVKPMIKVVPKDSGAKNARKLDPIESAKEHMDKVTFYNHDGLPSKLEIEKDIAALEQDPVSFDKKKNAPKLSAKKTSSNKDKSTSSADKKVTHNTHDLESKPIPLPFE